MSFASLDQQRGFADRLVFGLLLLHMVLNPVVIACIGGAWVLAGIASGGIVAACAASFAIAGRRTARLTSAVGVVATISVLVAGLEGQPWQLDMHMYYFAALAMLSIYCDPSIILLAAGGIALHHLTLDFLLPSAIYPGGGNFGRVTLHAVILSVEASVLFATAGSIAHLFGATDAALETAAKAQETAEAATRQVQQSRQAETELARSHAVLAQTSQRQLAGVIASLASGLKSLFERRFHHAHRRTPFRRLRGPADRF